MEELAASFADSSSHVLAELERIDLLVRSEVTRARQVAVADPHFQGLCVTEEEVDSLLVRVADLPTWATAPVSPDRVRVRQRVDALAKANHRRAQRAAREGTELRLYELAVSFGLTRFDADVLLLALALEIDPRYGRLYAYLQDDIAERRPTLDLVTNLLCSSIHEKLAARHRLAPSAPLRRHGLLVLHEDARSSTSGLLGRSLAVDDRTVEYVLGADEPADVLADCVRWHPATDRLEDLLIDPELLRRLVHWMAGGDNAAPPGVVYLQGPPGTGRSTLAGALSRHLGLPLLLVDGVRLRADTRNAFAHRVDAALREAALYGAALYWNGFDDLLGDDTRDDRLLLLDRIGERVQPTFLAGASPWEPAASQRHLPWIRVEVGTPGTATRADLWRRAIADQPLAAEVDLAELAGRFRLRGGEIRDAAATAHRLARWRAGVGEPVSTADVAEACRRHSDQSLAVLARHRPVTNTGQELVLPQESLEQLRDLCARVRHRAQVHDNWGFRTTIGPSDGLTALFTGPPGTGKTLAAQRVAGELGYDMYTVDLSTVVSKYIGETEKNLSRVFDAAERSNALLFFDEADALFGKRSEVRDARDRFANIEVSYLLQRMEQHEGLTVLATNMRNNIDTAFLRRLAFVIGFPFPDQQMRLRLWEGLWPPEAPRAPDVDFATLARDHELAGGSIRNVLVAAAFLAAEEGAPIGMDHLLHATRREQRNRGKSTGAGAGRPRRSADGNGRAAPVASGKPR